MSDALTIDPSRQEYIKATNTWADGRGVVEIDIFVRGMRLHLHVPVEPAMALVGQIDDAIGRIKEPDNG